MGPTSTSQHTTDLQEIEMYDARAAALATNGFAFFVLPPDGPSRSSRKGIGGMGPAGRLIRAIRGELARAAEEAPNVLPRVTHYPY